MLAGLAGMRVPIPVIGGDTAPLGAIGLTASAGLAGWLEFALLRRSLSRRAGAVRIPPGYLAQLWASAIFAGVAGAAFYHFVTPVFGAHLPHILPKTRDGLIVCGVYGIVYFASAMLLGVPEARATMGRFLLRSRP
jgi:putative peptidoglycan lipid II flippase